MDNRQRMEQLGMLLKELYDSRDNGPMNIGPTTTLKDLSEACLQSRSAICLEIESPSQAGTPMIIACVAGTDICKAVKDSIESFGLKPYRGDRDAENEG